MKRRYLPTLLGVLLLSGGVIAYNFWAFSTGRCTLATFFSLSTPAFVLILSNFVAFLVLCAIRSKNRQREDRYCSCGKLLHRSWHHCPDCGASSAPPTAPERAIGSV